MAQNANRAWSDSARDGGYISRDLQKSSDIGLPTDALPEFHSAFRERSTYTRPSRTSSQTFQTASTSQSAPPRPYAATLNRDYASRDEARVTRNPYGSLPRQSFQRRSGAYDSDTSLDVTSSQGAAPRLHAEAFQPMGSHSVAGQKRNTRSATSGRQTRRDDFEFEAPRNYRNSSDYSERPVRASRQSASEGQQDNRRASSQTKAAAPINAKAQKREERRRRRRHEQADKKFNRQFSTEASGVGDGGPRAAVTKAEMGSKQRKAMRAQQTGTFSIPFFGGALGTVIAGIGAAIMAVVHGFARWRTLKKTVCAVAIIVLVCACVYTPAQQYYQTLRLNDKLEAEYKAIEERNDALGLDLATLGTREGIEARAHEQFGLVEEGEESANVLGLDYTYDHSTTMMAAIPSGSVEMPDPAWYTPLLDAIFGIEKDEV